MHRHIDNILRRVENGTTLLFYKGKERDRLLALHLPLTGNIHNQGLLDEEVEIQQNLVWSDAGKLGKCIQFNGNANQILSFANVPKKTNNFTWACWVKQINRTSTTYNNTNQYVLSNGRDCGAIGFNILIHDGILIIHMGSGADDGSTTSTTNSRIQIQELSLNTWYHICCAVNDSNVMVYINGTLIKIFPLIEINFRSSRESYFTIGKMAYGHYSTASYFPFDGYVQDVRVYDTCLSPRQVKEISKGLVCHYPLGEIDGKISGRNLIKNGKGNVKAGFFKNFPTVTDEYAEFTLKSKKTYPSINLNDGFVYGCREYDVGAKYTWSYDIMYTVWNFPTGSNRAEFWMGQRYTIAPSGETATGTWSKVTQHNLPVIGQNGCKLNKWYHVKQTVTIPDPASSNVKQQAIIAFYNSNADVEASFTARIKNVKLEKSSTTTPWTPAPEDDASFYDNVIYDTSGYCNNGSVTDSTCPTWSSDTPRYKGSYVFNGSNQYFTFHNPISSAFDEFSISCWVKFDDTTGNSTICTMRTVIGNGIALFKVGNKIRFDDNAQFTFSDYTISANEWTHVVVTRASSAKKLYINGELKQLTSTVGDMANVYDIGSIGASSASGNGSGNYTKGNISDFRIYATALDNQTIEELYKVGALVDNNGNLMLAGEVIEE